MTGDLTPRQDQVLAVIVESIRTRGRPPTIRELAAALEVTSTNGVVQHLDLIARKGYLRRSPLLSRGIELTTKGATAFGLDEIVDLARIARLLDLAGVPSPAGSIWERIEVALERLVELHTEGKDREP